MWLVGPEVFVRALSMDESRKIQRITRTKMCRILDLYDHPPADGRVVCVDECGPLNLQDASQPPDDDSPVLL